MHPQLSSGRAIPHYFGSIQYFPVSGRTKRQPFPKVWTCYVYQRDSTADPVGIDDMGSAADGTETMKERKKRRKRVLSEEHKAKIAATWKARPRQFSDETREKMRQAKLSRQHSIITRNKMAQSHLGRKHDEETKLKMSRARKLWWEQRKQQQQQMASQQAEETQQKKKGTRQAKTRSGNGALQARWEDEQLSREAAVFELMRLRREVGHLVAELSMKGELPETAEEVGLHPNVHRKLWRYVWLLDAVRSAPVKP